MSWLLGALILGIVLLIIGVVSSKDGKPGIISVIGILLISAVEYILPIAVVVGIILLFVRACS